MFSEEEKELIKSGRFDKNKKLIPYWKRKANTRKGNIIHKIIKAKIIKALKSMFDFLKFFLNLILSEIMLFFDILLG